MDPAAQQGRVADVALRRLVTNGFAHTSLDDIARAASIPAADLRARFGDTEGLLTELVSPLLRRLEESVRAAADADLVDPAQLRRVIAEYYDTLAAHRLAVGLVLDDPTAIACESVRKVRAAMVALRHELARGIGSDVDHRIRATAAVGAVHAAMLEGLPADPATVRQVVIDAAVAIVLS